MATTSKGFRYPVSTDTPNVPRDIGYLASDVDNWITNNPITINGTPVTLGGTVSITGLPTQTGNNGKYLTTDGSTASWATIDLSSYLTTANAASTYLTISNASTTYAAKASPTFTGTPLAPTATAGTNTTQIATTAFVSTAVSNLVNSAPSTLDTLNELAAALGNDASFSTTVTNSIAGKVSKSGGDTITASSASVVPIILKGTTSQTADLQQWQDSSGNVLLGIAQNGFVYNPINTSRTSIGMVSASGTMAGAYFQVFGNNYTIASQRGGAEFVFSNQNFGTGGFTIFESDNASWIPRLKIFNNGYTSINSSSSTLGSSSANNQFGVVINSSTTVGAVIRSAVSQTANLQEWQNSSGSVLSAINQYGSIVTYYGIYSSAAVGFGTSIGNYSAQVNINTTNASTIGAVIRGAASQTANLQEWQNSAGTVLTKVDSSGNITAQDYKLPNSYYSLRKTIKKTVDPLSAANANNTYDLFQMDFTSSLQGTFYAQVSIRNSGYGQNMTYSLPVSYAMDWINNYALTNPFTDGTTWVDLTPLTFSPRHLMLSDYLKLQVKVTNNTIYFRIKLTGSLTSSPVFDVYLQHSEEFANCTITELYTTGTDSTTSNVMPNFLSSKAGSSAIFNPLKISSSIATTVPLTVKGYTSQSANLQEWQNSSGTVLAYINSGGLLSTNAITANSTTSSTLTTALTLSNSGTGTGTGVQMVFNYGGVNYASISSIYSGSPLGANMVFNVGSTTSSKMIIDGNGTLTVNGFSASSQGVIIRGAASQTANLQEWQDSNGTVKAKITAAGAIDVTAITVNGSPISGGSSTPAASDVELMSIMGAY